MTKQEYLAIVELAKEKVSKYIELHSMANYDPGVTRKEDDFGYWLAVSAQEIVKGKVDESN